MLTIFTAFFERSRDAVNVPSSKTTTSTEIRPWVPYLTIEFHQVLLTLVFLTLILLSLITRMRKYWQISALDRKEVSHSGGTLQALLASGWSDALVTLLTQPTIDIDSIDSTYPRLCIKQGSRR